jgi:hypothetical protein
MAKDAYYFSHDFNSRNDEKILKIRTKFKNAEGYGIFWMIVEAMAESSDGSIDSQAIAELSFSFNLPLETLSTFIAYAIDIGLFIKSGDRITSKRIQQHKQFRHSLSDAGKEGAAKRWPGYAKAIATPMLSKVKESKVKEKKDIHPYSEQVQQVFDFFCITTKKKYQLSQERAKIIEQRFKEGRTIEEMKQAIYNFSKDTWEDRVKFCDIVYVLGTRNKVNNLDKWLNAKPEEKPELL